VELETSFSKINVEDKIKLDITQRKRGNGDAWDEVLGLKLV